MDSEQNNKLHVTSSATKRFVPTCSICGNKHWPRDPSCAGKKGAKAKAKAKGTAKAKARAKRLGLNQESTYPPADAAVQVQAERPAAEPTYPAKPNVYGGPIEPSSKPVFPPRENTDIQPEPQQEQEQQAGERVLSIKAESEEEITSFTDEITRIKRQADEVVLRISEDASHQVQSERTARIFAEEKAINEAAGRLKAEQKLQEQIDKLKSLQEEARLVVQANKMQMQEIQAQFTDVTNTDGSAAVKPFESGANSVSIPIDPGHTGSNTATLLAIKARQIMETNVIQVSGDDTISSVLDQMLTRDSYYAIVTGQDCTEGIVSRADLTGPVSEYLQPLIAKWKRKDSDATFNLAVKWVMSRQVNTIEADAACTAIMKKMRQLNMCPLLVIQEGKAIGLVTPFNVFKIRALLKLESDSTSTTNRQLIEALPARISSYLAGLEEAKNPQQQLEV